MKTIKLSFLKMQQNLSKSYGTINLKIKSFEAKNAIELANLLRRKLLTDTVRLEHTKHIGKNIKNKNYLYNIIIIFLNTLRYLLTGIKITKSILFIGRNKRYYKTNEFENLEEIDEKRNKIEYNLTKIKFKYNNENFSKKVIAIDLRKEENTGGQIEISPELVIINKNQLICKVKSSEIKQKLLIKIEMRNKVPKIIN
jgi:hypothetical protein